MLLKGSDGEEFEMEVAGYQFPHLEQEQDDSDWLKIKISVRLREGSWTSTDPSLLTWELTSLAQWLESIAEGASVESEESFLEPNLRFEITQSEAKTLRVYFELESRPPWAPSDGAGMDDLFAEFAVNPDDLRDAASSLREDLKRFPVRVGY
jgi:hypothetical protein